MQENTVTKLRIFDPM